jgi:hypothetical protein
MEIKELYMFISTVMCIRCLSISHRTFGQTCRPTNTLFRICCTETFNLPLVPTCSYLRLFALSRDHIALRHMPRHGDEGCLPQSGVTSSVCGVMLLNFVTESYNTSVSCMRHVFMTKGHTGCC